MIQRLTISFIFILLCFKAFTQQLAQNRIVYNRIEYFFNTQQTDSIYALANNTFQKQISPEDFKSVLTYFYKFGTIKEATQVTEENRLIGYNLDFQNKKCYLQMAVDSIYHFDTFIIKEQPYVTIDIKDIKSNVTKMSIVDYFVDSIAKTYLTNATTASLSIGIIHNNKINTFFYGETLKGDKNSLPDANTIYEIGSITKVFTSILLADLVEKDIISLDDSIGSFLPDSVKTNTALCKITFRQLANHTSGLPRLPANLEASEKFNKHNPYATYSSRELYHFLKNVQLGIEPGDNYEYSNLAFGLLGEIITNITKKTYAQNINEIITTPLSLMNTVEKIDPKTQKKIQGHNTNGEVTPLWDFKAMAGAGSLKSTITDLLRFAQYQFKMPENTLENAMALTRQFTFYLPPTTDIGLGWHMNMTNDVVSYWHNGGTGGSSSFIAIVPDLKSAIIVLSNSAQSVDAISTQILEKVLNTK